MKILHLLIIVIIGITVILTYSHIEFVAAQSAVILDTSMPPITITQVELWGPTSFYTDGVKSCESDGISSLGPWALGWIELYNTKNETVRIDDVYLTGKGWEEDQPPITLGPKEYCYFVTQDSFTTRIGVGGSLGNGSPIRENSTITLAYSIQPFAGKMLYKYSTPKLNDNFGDTRTWQLIDGNWVFKEANIKHEFPIKTTLLSPSKQIQSRLNVKDLKCEEGFVVTIKKSDPKNWHLPDSPACVKPSSASVLIERGWGVPEQVMQIPNTNSTLTYYVEGSKLDQIVPDLATRGLTLSLNTTGDSKMTLFLPRSFIDSPQIGDYTSFNVTADGNKIDYQEYLTPTDRMFVILFPNGTKSIGITPKPFTENQTSVQLTSHEIPSIFPGEHILSSCGGGAVQYHSSSNILNSTGFSVYHNVMNYSYITNDDYVIQPGHRGTITYVIDAGSSPTSHIPYPVQKELNVTNYAIFYHRITNYEELLYNPSVTISGGDYKSCFKRPDGSCAGVSGPITGPIDATVVDHPGVSVSFEPAAELLQYNDTAKGKSSQIITMTVSVDANSPQGTYWVILSPEECLGGEIFLFTVGNEPYHK